MVKKERWGPKRNYPRDWIEYNEELVVRGEFLLNLDWVKSWDQELDRMNANKQGRRYLYPNSLIELQAVWHQLIDLRGIEGLTRKLSEMDLIPKYDDYSTICRRINKIDIRFELPKNKNVCISCDGTGMKMNNSGEYLHSMYGKGKKKYIKVIILADTNNKSIYAVDAYIDGEDSSEPKTAEKQIKQLVKKNISIDKFHGDGGFDSRQMFNCLYKIKAEPAIKIRKNAIKNAKGCFLRKKEVIAYKEKGYEEWAKDKDYGMRWPATEGIFSAVKRKFGEKTRSTLEENMCKEVKRRFWAYESMKNYAKA